MTEDAKIASTVILGVIAFLTGGLALWLAIDVVSGFGFGGLLLLGIPIGLLSLVCVVSLIQISRNWSANAPDNGDNE